MKHSLFLILTILYGFPLLSQSEVNKDRELQVQKNYNNDIYAAHPVFDFANINLPKTANVNISMDSMAGAPSFVPGIDLTIKPIAYKTNLSKTGHKGMIKLDKGTINPWHAQGAYVYTSPNHFIVYASGEYDNWQEKAIEDKSINMGKAEIGATYYITSDLKLDIDINYNNQKYGLYSGQDSNSEPLGNTNHYSTLGFNFGIQTFRAQPSKWNMRLNIDANKWSDRNYNTKENNIALSTYFQYKVNENITLKTIPEYKLSHSEAYQTTNLLSNIISAELDHKAYKFSIGVNTSFIQDTWNIWPSADINWQLNKTDKLLINATQEIKINSAEEIVKYNPYSNLQSLPITNQDNEFIKDYYMDRKVSIAYNSNRITDWNLSLLAEYHFVNRDQNFNLMNIGPQFEISRVDYNYLNTQLGVTRSMLDDLLYIGLNLNYNKYLKASKTLLHRPDWKITPTVKSHLLNNKLTLDLSTTINSPQLLAIENSTEIKSSWRTNASFTASYKLIDNINIYLNADNIFNDKYQVWNGYDNFGRNLSAGILLKL